MASIQLVGLGAPLGAAGGAGVGRLGQVRLNPRPRELLDHIPPAGAALQRERGLPAGELLQPHPQVLTVGRGELAALALAAVAVDPVEGDLAAVHVKPTYDSHRDLLRAPPTGLQHDHPCLSRRGSLYMSSFITRRPSYWTHIPQESGTLDPTRAATIGWPRWVGSGGDRAGRA